MSGAIMTLIFLGVPFLLLMSLLLRGALRSIQQRRFARAMWADIDRPGPPRAQP
ncbi:hypothetical protein [Nannocystis punicea]|uniref:Uncharacterized protein n=1 Tax=Nannocystis punicea TaxID=2995304 RepID=A0ABY7H4Y6_9BACT|nr:hypothetical protein [Nannocystis poenicansa]WAS94172.1 hypothetical protein O0S08_49245 [Nannocystis poenicansa]